MNTGCNAIARCTIRLAVTNGNSLIQNCIALLALPERKPCFQVPEYAFVQKRRNVEYALFTIRKFQVQFISG